MWMFPEKELAA